jgi:hypothetical protein
MASRPKGQRGDTNSPVDPIERDIDDLALRVEDETFEADVDGFGVGCPTPRAFFFVKGNVLLHATGKPGDVAGNPESGSFEMTTENSIAALKETLQRSDVPEKREELFEIKPRVRDQEDTARDPPRATFEQSAFNELPAAAVYDPSWYNSPLRAEAGQLGKSAAGDEKDRKRPTTSGPVLPGAFTLTSSADLEDEDDEDDHDVQLDSIAAQTIKSSDLITRGSADALSSIASAAQAKPVSMGRLALGNMSFLSRKKTTQGSNDSLMTPRDLFMTNETAENVMEMMQFILRSNFTATELAVSSRGRPELRSKVKIPTEDNVHVTFGIVMNADATPAGSPGAGAGVVVSLRRSKGDKAKVSTESLRRFGVTLVARYRNASPNATITILGSTDPGKQTSS